MTIYYSNEFNNIKGESHKWLQKAIGLELDKELGGTVDQDKIALLVENMTIGELGKPEIESVRDFSISHSRNVWAVLFDDAPCGLDVQEHRPIDYSKIAKRWYHEKEYDQVIRAEENVECVFYGIWARREALVKAVGTSIVTFQGLVLNEDFDPNDDSYEDVLFEGHNWKLRNIRIPGAEGMSVAICCKNSGDIEFVDLGGNYAK